MTLPARAILCSFPCPSTWILTVFLEKIAPEKDADGLHPTNLGKLVLNVSEPLDSPLPCTPNGVIELVKRHGIDWNGKNVVVLGRGITVGRPLGLLLTAVRSTQPRPWRIPVPRTLTRFCARRM